MAEAGVRTPPLAAHLSTSCARHSAARGASLIPATHARLAPARLRSHAVPPPLRQVRPLVISLLEQKHEQAEALVHLYNAVIRRVLDFRWRHLSFIEQYPQLG